MHIYALLNDNGQVIFPKPLSLKRETIEIEIIIPDDMIANNATDPLIIETASTQTSKIRQQLNDILGKYGQRRPAISPTEDKAAWHQHLENMHL